MRLRAFGSLLALVGLMAGTRPASAQKYVGVIDMPAGFDMYGGSGMSINPGTGRLYTPDYQNYGVIVSDTKSDTVLYELPASNPSATIYDASRNRVYVQDNYGIQVFDAASDTYVRTLGGYGWGLAINPRTGLIYSASGTQLQVVNADAAPDDPGLVAVIGLGAAGVYNAWSVVVNPSTNTIYVADDSSVAVVDGGSGKIVAVLDYPGNGYIPTIAIDVELNRIYVPAFDGVVVIDGSTNQIRKWITHPGGGMGVAVNPVTHRVYVANDFWISGSSHSSASPSKQLVVIDGTLGEVAGVFHMPYAQGIAVDPTTGLVYLADRGNVPYNNVYVFQDVAAKK